MPLGGDVRWSTNTKLLLYLMIVVSGAAFGEKYSVSLTRRSGNFYQIDGKEIFVQTRYCYVYSYGEDAVLDTDLGAVHFLDSNDRCDVATYYVRTTLKPGKYSVTVSRKDDNLYEVMGTSIVLRTSLCLELALGNEAVLDWQAPGFGTLHFLGSSDTSCGVQQALSRRSTL